MHNNSYFECKFIKNLFMSVENKLKNYSFRQYNLENYFTVENINMF